MGVAVIMERPGKSLVPGAKTTSDVRIRNTGAVVDQFVLDVVGEAASWTHVEPASVNLMPGQEGTATIVFSPPKSSRVVEGPVPFALRVMSREDTAGSAVQEGVVDVGAYTKVAGELVPRTSAGRRRGRHQLALDNLGNRPELVTIAAGDPDLELDFRIDPANPRLAAGTATFVKVVAKPKRTFLRGPNRTLPFQVTVTPRDGDPVLLGGTMVQTAVLPRWFLKALALALAAAVALVALWLVVLKPAVESTAKTVAEDSNKELAEAITDAASSAAQAQQDAAAAKEEAAGDAGGKKGESGAGEDAGTAATGTLDPGQATDFIVTTEVSPPGDFEESTFVPPAETSVWVSDLVLQNPAGDAGTLRIQRGDDVLMVFGLENFRDLDYHFIQPALFTEEEPVVVAVDCENPTDDDCTPSVYFSGRAIKEKKPATPASGSSREPSP